MGGTVKPGVVARAGAPGLPPMGAGQATDALVRSASWVGWPASGCTVTPSFVLNVKPRAYAMRLFKTAEGCERRTLRRIDLCHRSIDVGRAER